MAIEGESEAHREGANVDIVPEALDGRACRGDVNPGKGRATQVVAAEPGVFVAPPGHDTIPLDARFDRIIPGSPCGTVGHIGQLRGKGVEQGDTARQHRADVAQGDGVGQNIAGSDLGPISPLDRTLQPGTPHRRGGYAGECEAQTIINGSRVDDTVPIGQTGVDRRCEVDASPGTWADAAPPLYLIQVSIVDDALGGAAGHEGGAIRNGVHHTDVESLDGATVAQHDRIGENIARCDSVPVHHFLRAAQIHSVDVGDSRLLVHTAPRIVDGRCVGDHRVGSQALTDLSLECDDLRWRGRRRRFDKQRQMIVDELFVVNDRKAPAAIIVLDADGGLSQPYALHRFILKGKGPISTEDGLESVGPAAAKAADANVGDNERIHVVRPVVGLTTYDEGEVIPEHGHQIGLCGAVGQGPVTEVGARNGREGEKAVAAQIELVE